jgi:putative ABC transport system permease protein
MNLLKLSWKNIVYRPLSSGLSILLLAAGIAIILITLLTSRQIDDKFKSNIEDIDIVIGAKGSRLQLVLCNIFHIDNPTGNIKYAKTKFLNNHLFVDKAIPLSLGDNYQSYRIVGTTHEYVELFKGEIAQGKLWEEPLEAVVGYSLAKKFYLKVGDTFAGGHGLGESTHSHDDMLYKVVGVLERSHTVLDNLVLTSLESVWLVHSGEDHQAIGSFNYKTIDDFGGDTLAMKTYLDSLQTINIDSIVEAQAVVEEFVDHNDPNHDHSKCNHIAHHPEKYKEVLAAMDPMQLEVTAVLVKVKSPKGKMMIPGMINNMDGLMAADVAIEMQLLSQLMSPALGVMEMLAYVIMFIAAISMFVATFNSLKDRQYEIALMRVMGSSAAKIFITILFEGIILALLGFLTGWLLSHIGMSIFAGYLTEQYHYDFSGWIFLKEEIYILAGALVIGIVSALYPAFKAYSVDISNTLSK